MKHFPNIHPFISRSIKWLCLAFAVAAPGLSLAQITVDLKLDRSVYISHEPISGKLTIVNRAGRDLIFGNVNGQSWLDYTITDSSGHLVSPIAEAPGARPVVIASGQTHRMNITVNQIYPMSQIGTYRVKANVSFPQINRVFESKTIPVQVAEGKPLWSQIVGVPQGFPGAGTYRVYELLTYFHGSRSKALYLRVRDNSNGQVYRTYSLGDYLTVRPPKQGIDRNNQLHVLHMSGPQQYKYTVVDLDGEVLTRETYFEKNGNRPNMVSTDFGEVEVRGGITEEEAKTPYERREFRLISERPPGLPRL